MGFICSVLGKKNRKAKVRLVIIRTTHGRGATDYNGGGGGFGTTRDEEGKEDIEIKTGDTSVERVQTQMAGGGLGQTIERKFSPHDPIWTKFKRRKRGLQGKPVKRRRGGFSVRRHLRKDKRSQHARRDDLPS